MVEVTAVFGDCRTAFERVQALMVKAGAEVVWDEPSETATHTTMLESVRRTKLALVGYEHVANDRAEMPPSVRMRQDLEIFAQHRPIRPLSGVSCRFDDADLLVIRETTEDVYASLEHESIPGVYESLKVTTRAACKRIATHAFEVARRQGRRKVTIVHKANIMKMSDGMFLATAREVASLFPDITCEDCIVDALCMKIVIDPSKFDVLLCGNLFGDIVGDLCAGMAGGVSNAPSINFAMNGAVLFTAGHGDTSDAGERANPLPVLLPALHLLNHIGDGAAARLEFATTSTLQAGIVPFGAGGTASLNTFCDAVASRL